MGGRAHSHLCPSLSPLPVHAKGRDTLGSTLVCAQTTHTHIHTHAHTHSLSHVHTHTHTTHTHTHTTHTHTHTVLCANPLIVTICEGVVHGMLWMTVHLSFSLCLSKVAHAMF